MGFWLSPEAQVHPKVAKATGPAPSTRTKSDLVRLLRDKLSAEFPDIMAQAEMFEQLQQAAAAAASGAASGRRRQKFRPSFYDQDVIYAGHQQENMRPVEVPVDRQRRKLDRVRWFMDTLDIRPSDTGTAYAMYTFDKDAVIPFCFADGFKAQMMTLCGATWPNSSVQACKGAFQGWTCGTNTVTSASLYPLQYDYRLWPKLMQERAMIEQPPFDGTQPPPSAVNGPVFQPQGVHTLPGSAMIMHSSGQDIHGMNSAGGVGLPGSKNAIGSNGHSKAMKSMETGGKLPLQRQTLSSPTGAPCTRNFEPVCCRVDGISQPVLNMCTCKTMYGVFVAPGPVCPPGIRR